jgi:hypothetical protein
VGFNLVPCGLQTPRSQLAPWTLRIYMGSFDRFNLRISPARISPPADAPPVKFITAPPQQHQRRSL